MTMLQLAYIEDHAMCRKSLAKLIVMNYTDCCVHEYENGSDFIEAVTRDNYLPTLVLMDIAMPKMNGYDTTAWLKKYHPNIPVLVISMISKEEAILKMLQLGAKGFITKCRGPEKIFEAIEAIMEGGTYYSTKVHYKIANGTLYENGRKVVPDKQPLTKREEEILALIGTNKTYNEIASLLFISAATVETHKNNIAAKLKIHSYQHLAVYAIQVGLVHSI